MHCSKHRALRCGIHAWSIAWSIARCVNWHAWSIAPSILGLPPSLFGPSSTGRCLSFLGGLCSSSQGAAALALQPFVHQAARRRRELAEILDQMARNCFGGTPIIRASSAGSFGNGPFSQEKNSKSVYAPRSARLNPLVAPR